MNVTMERSKHVLTMVVNGRIDWTTVPVFENAIRTEIEETDRSLILDFEDVSYIDSAGLRVVLLIAKSLRARGASLALCALSVPVRDVFRITGFESVLPIYETRMEALAGTGG